MVWKNNPTSQALPLQHDHQDTLLSGSSDNSLSQNPLPRSPHHILIAEFDHDVASLIRALLVREGYNVTVTHDGHEAIKALNGPNIFDAVVCDIMLPHANGLQLIRDVRSITAYENIPIMVLSSMAMERHIVNVLNAGANEYITKPFRPGEFVARLNRYLLNKRS